jgi:hypothetical protein
MKVQYNVLHAQGNGFCNSLHVLASIRVLLEVLYMCKQEYYYPGQSVAGKVLLLCKQEY